MGSERKFSDDVIISACCTNDPILNQFLGKCDLYGEPKYVGIISNVDTAGDIAESIGLDKLITQGIYTGLEIASPTYEEVGEKFLKDTLQDYSKGTYGADLIRGILRKLSNERLGKICKGVKDILDTGDSKFKEAKFALFIYECFHMTDSLEDRSDANSLSIAAIRLSLEHIEKTGEFTIVENSVNYTREIMNDPKTKHRQKNKWKQECRDNLDFAFNYFMNNINEIQSFFIDYFPNMDRRKIVAYYVTTRPDTGLLEFVEKIKKGN